MQATESPKTFFREAYAGKYFIPFHSLVSVVKADDAELLWLFQSRLFNITLRSNTMLKVRWDELSKVELVGEGSDMQMRIVPRNKDRFKGGIGGFTSLISLKTDKEGAIAVLAGDEARRLYATCSLYVPS